MSRSRAFALTTNNYTEEQYAIHVAEMASTEYSIVGKEVGGEEHTPHLQCYFRYKNARAFATMKKRFPTSHIESAKGDDVDNRAYCSKDGDFVEHGTPKEKRPGKRSDLAEFVSLVSEEIPTWKQVVMNHPHIAAHHPDWAKSVISIARESKVSRASPVEVSPYPWQTFVIRCVEHPPDDRHILWIYDAEGASGKSALARYLVDNHGAFYTNGGKANDIAYSYDCEPIVIFDYVRDSQEFVSYGIIEALKNGILTSNKYQSQVKRFDPPHVFVFANFPPAPNKFSADRIIIRTPQDLNEEAVH